MFEIIFSCKIASLIFFSTSINYQTARRGRGSGKRRGSGKGRGKIISEINKEEKSEKEIKTREFLASISSLELEGRGVVGSGVSSGEFPS